MALEYDKDRRRAVHFDTKTTLWIVFSALAVAAGLFAWGMNIQERVGVVETQQTAIEQRSLIRHDALSRRIDDRANITENEISRIEARFDKLDASLLRIEEKLDKKVDRNGQ
mgnify:CR=1 FL=1